ncbi:MULTISPECIES: hypothetical protein [unclassified Aeromicrobium]|uniref:hypothetical protein n=1 Tax=unclassified Aeromicrobium TaxID=2633570 RepID=UPI0010D4B027|nr:MULTISPECIES: hypothetical protein [unclassified Aeromicrobium]RYY51012.1 MAG: hypothetical protein EON53_01950 [Actinomycetales bacterium]
MGANRRYGDRSPADHLERAERIRHVWVAPSAKHPDMAPYPGLLITWQRRDGQWWAHVAMILPEGAVVLNWLPAARLRPAAAAPPTRPSTTGR